MALTCPCAGHGWTRKNRRRAILQLWFSGWALSRRVVPKCSQRNGRSNGGGFPLAPEVSFCQTETTFLENPNTVTPCDPLPSLPRLFATPCCLARQRHHASEASHDRPRNRDMRRSCVRWTDMDLSVEIHASPGDFGRYGQQSFWNKMSSELSQRMSGCPEKREVNYCGPNFHRSFCPVHR